MGVPNDAGTMLRFVRNVRATARNSDKPIVVHCRYVMDIVSGHNSIRHCIHSGLTEREGERGRGEVILEFP